MDVELRVEAVGDHTAIRHVNQAAFGGDAEADLVDVLRNGGFAKHSDW